MQSTESSYNVPPFPAFPATSRYVPLGSVQEAMGRVCRSIEAREAISLVIGPPGTGKSLICGLLTQHYRESHEVVVIGETPIADGAALLRRLLHHLNADLANIPDGDLQLALIDRVCKQDGADDGLLIIVDEAQTLSVDVLEAIRMVTNITRDGEPRVFAVLCGGVKLDETLVETSLEAFTQRVATRCYLHPMNGEETKRYVTETIRNCGAEPGETVTDGAIGAVHHACCGVPRLINQMLTQAIDCAEEAEQALITEQIVDDAWSQLQQLPSPMVEEPKLANNAAPIEFGQLDESVSFGELSSEDEPSDEPTDEPGMAAAPVAQTGESDQCETGPCESGHCEASHDEMSDSSADIEFESGTAQWVDDSVVDQESDSVVDQESIDEASVIAEYTPSQAALFGEFEEEEEIPVGNGVARTVTPAPANDLEAMLHQEIVGMGSMDALPEIMDPQMNVDQQDEVETSGEADRQSDEEESDEEEYVEEVQKECVEDFIALDEQNVTQSGDALDSVLSMSTEDESGPIELDDIAVDDCDILVIEDEVELRRIDTSARLDAQDQTISVDFQAMLNRMRTGSHA